MALPRRGYIPVYLDWLEKTEPLTDAEKGQLVDAMIAYACDGELVEMTGNVRAAFPWFRERIDNARKEYDNKVKAGSSRSEQKLAEANRTEQKETEASRSEQEQAEANRTEQERTERSKNSKDNNINNNNNKDPEIIIIIFKVWEDCKGSEITEADKTILRDFVSVYGEKAVQDKIKAMSLCAKDKTLAYLKASLENEKAGVRKGKHGPETQEEKEKRERAEEIDKWVWNQQINADLRTNKESEACP